MKSSELIKDLRDKLNLTQKDFGKILGVSGTTVYMWECGRPELKSYEILGIMTLVREFHRVKMSDED